MKAAGRGRGWGGWWSRGGQEGRSLSSTGTAAESLFRYWDSGEECLWGQALLHFSAEIKFEKLCFVSSLEKRFYFAFFFIHQFQGLLLQTVGSIPSSPRSLGDKEGLLPIPATLSLLFPQRKQIGNFRDCIAGIFPSPSWNQSVLPLSDTILGDSGKVTP